ncbi:glycosyltransferase family 39 protein [Halochromatium glycolicum]|uniref:Glycosyltransferase RgtA/B/C/D-like domain-containing protein n=1 Tax=Halochromatium glycolicum TaxID=85075 RepID=A0AAJ0U1Q3_9GAMM|nr:glycosyltransferase family 39 protein [Halochromatium glycolicum]MBK1703255.1 hypothetical protein [Halochromatium glycolicum]
MDNDQAFRPTLRTASGEKRGLDTTVFLIGGALAYFMLNAVLLGLVSSTAEWDHAEQLLLGQVWQLGYNSQPPLYTWIVKALFLLTGPSLAVLLALKALLLTLLVAAVALIGRELKLSPAQQWIAVLGLALIPQIVWEDQRNFTHTVLAVTVAAWTLFQLLRLRRAPSIGHYLLLGLLLGLGALSKYNYGLFAAGLGLAALSLPAFRAVLWSARALLTLGLAGALLLPHLVWVGGHLSKAQVGFQKLEMGAGLGFAGLSELGAGILASLGALLLLAMLVVRPQHIRQHILQRIRQRDTEPGVALLLRGWIAMLLLALLMILTTGARDFQEHWLQPLTFFVPLLLACWAEPGAGRGFQVFRSIALVVLLGVSIALPGQALLANPERPSRLNLPYAELAAQIRAEIGAPEVIVAPSDPLAGNLRLHFPDARVLSQRNPFAAPEQASQWLIVSEQPLQPDSRFMRWLTAELGLNRLAPSRQVSAPLHWMPDQAHRLYWTLGDPEARRP